MDDPFGSPLTPAGVPKLAIPARVESDPFGNGSSDATQEAPRNHDLDPFMQNGAGHGEMLGGGGAGQASGSTPANAADPYDFDFAAPASAPANSGSSMFQADMFGDLSMPATAPVPSAAAAPMDDLYGDAAQLSSTSSDLFGTAESATPAASSAPSVDPFADAADVSAADEDPYADAALSTPAPAHAGVGMEDTPSAPAPGATPSFDPFASPLDAAGGGAEMASAAGEITPTALTPHPEESPTRGASEGGVVSFGEVSFGGEDSELRVEAGDTRASDDPFAEMSPAPRTLKDLVESDPFAAAGKKGGGSASKSSHPAPLPQLPPPAVRRAGR
jgi:hypothetical protein